MHIKNISEKSDIRYILVIFVLQIFILCHARLLLVGRRTDGTVKSYDAGVFMENIVGDLIHSQIDIDAYGGGENHYDEQHCECLVFTAIPVYVLE